MKLKLFILSILIFNCMPLIALISVTGLYSKNIIYTYDNEEYGNCYVELNITHS